MVPAAAGGRATAAAHPAPARPIPRIAVARIAVPEDGEYRVDVQGFDVEGAAVAIGDVSFGALFKDFGIGLLLFILGIFLLIPVWRARTPKAVRRARRLG